MAEVSIQPEGGIDKSKLGGPSGARPWAGPPMLPSRLPHPPGPHQAPDGALALCLHSPSLWGVSGFTDTGALEAACLGPALAPAYLVVGTWAKAQLSAPVSSSVNGDDGPTCAWALVRVQWVC